MPEDQCYEIYISLFLVWYQIFGKCLRILLIAFQTHIILSPGFCSEQAWQCGMPSAQVLNRNGSGCFKNHGSGLGLLGNFLYSIGVLNGTPPEAGNNSLCRKLQEYFLFFSLLFFIALSFCFDPCLFNKLLQALRSPGCYQPKIQQRRIFFRKHPSFQFLRNLPQIT